MTAIVIPRGELAYAAVTSTQTTTAVYGDPAVDIPGMVVAAVPVGSRPIRVDVQAIVFDSATTNSFQLTLLEDGVQVQQMNGYLAASGSTQTANFWVRLNPTAGAHTYKVQWFQVGAGTLTMVAGAAYPASILVTEV